MIGRGNQVRRPIYIGDLADGLVGVATAQSGHLEGQTLDLAGPREYTYERLVDLFAYAAMKRPRKLALSPAAFWYVLQTPLHQKGRQAATC